MVRVLSSVVDLYLNTKISFFGVIWALTFPSHRFSRSLTWIVPQLLIKYSVSETITDPTKSFSSTTTNICAQFMVQSISLCFKNVLTLSAKPSERFCLSPIATFFEEIFTLRLKRIPHWIHERNEISLSFYQKKGLLSCPWGFPSSTPARMKKLYVNPYVEKQNHSFKANIPN